MPITWFKYLCRRQLSSRVVSFIINILFFLSIIDKKINIKNKPELLCLRLLNITCLTTCSIKKINSKMKNGDKWMPVHIPLVSIKLINSKMKMVTNECLFMYHLLYQINKFKKDIWRQIISYSFIAFQFILYRNPFAYTF